MSIDNDTRTRAHAAGGTITWGVILLVIAGISFAIVMFDVSVLTPAVIGWGIVGLGGLLIVAAIVGGVARAVSAGSPASTGSTTGGGSASEGGSSL